MHYRDEYPKSGILSAKIGRIISHFDWPDKFGLPRNDGKLRNTFYHVCGFRDFYTANVIAMDDFEIDHIMPFVFGGPNHVFNYMPSSSSINLRKSTAIDFDVVPFLFSYLREVFYPKIAAVYAGEDVATFIDSFDSMESVHDSLFKFFKMFPFPKNLVGAPNENVIRWAMHKTKHLPSFLNVNSVYTKDLELVQIVPGGIDHPLNYILADKTFSFDKLSIAEQRNYPGILYHFAMTYFPYVETALRFEHIRIQIEESVKHEIYKEDIKTATIEEPTEDMFNDFFLKL